MDPRFASIFGGADQVPGLGQTLYSGMFGGGLPQPLTQGGNDYRPDKRNAPVYSSAGVTQTMNTPWNGMGGVMRNTQPQTFNAGRLDPMLEMTVKAGDSGGIERGAAAFLGGGYNPFAKEYDAASGTMVDPKNQSLSSLFDTARSLGMDTSKYQQQAGGVDIRGNRLDTGGPNGMDLYNDLNNHARDYVSVGGLSSGWAGGGPGQASRTIYKEVDGRLLPVTRPALHQRQTNNGLISRDAIQGLSMVLPAFGGWAGMLGSGASGTLTAGGGLGLTSGLSSTIGTGLTNALVNGGVNALLSRNPMALLGGLAQTGIGAGLSQMTGGGGLSNLFSTVGASSPMNVNPMSYFTGNLRNAGLGGSPLSQGVQGIQGLRTLSNLFGRA